MTNKLSRRDFLNAAGAVGGSTAVFRAAVALGLLPVAAHARPQVATITKPRKVLILGAGISGLTAAYELSKKGYEVQVLEASFRAGGRNQTAPGVVLPVDYVPDYLDNYELGFKSRWDGGRYAFNFTAFEMKWDDYQVEVVDPGAFPEFYVVMVANIGDAEIDGISTDFTATRQPGGRRGGALEFTIGDGRARISASTFSGRIHINNQSSDSNTRRDDE